jgi:hypothetical protein
LEISFKAGKSLEECGVEAINAAMEYWKKHGVETPIGTTYDFLNTSRLMKSCSFAFEHWQKEKAAKKKIVLATEQAFVLKLPDGNLTGGRADQIIEWNGRVWGRDFKTTSKLGAFYERSLEPNDQFTRYTWAESKLAGRVVEGQVVEVMFNSKNEGPKIADFMTSRTDHQIEEWLKGNTFWMNLIKLSRDTDHYPMNEKSCTFCEYHSVCRMPGPASMMQHLQSNYKYSPWNFQHTED